MHVHCHLNLLDKKKPLDLHCNPLHRDKYRGKGVICFILGTTSRPHSVMNSVLGEQGQRSGGDSSSS